MKNSNRRLIRVRGNSLAFVVDTAPSISSRSQSWRGQVYQVRPAVSLNDSRVFCRIRIKTFAMPPSRTNFATSGTALSGFWMVLIA